jgi:hypothetical protein
MSDTPPVGTPGTMSVSDLIASMQRDMANALTLTVAAADLQGTQLLYSEEHIMGPSPAVEAEREGGLGTFGWGGLSMVCHWCFFLREMDTGFVWVELGMPGCACCRQECALWRSMIKTNWPCQDMVHILAPAAKQTKFDAYEDPDCCPV